MSFPPMTVTPDPISGKRLDSWKEIAAFFGRAERTVKRWETERGLPVHRVPGGGRSAVFAYTNELADWLKGRGRELDAAEEEHDTQSSQAGSQPPDAGASPSETIPAPVQKASPGKGRSAARIVAWTVPLVLAAGVVIYFSVGRDGLHFKALANRHAPNAEAQDLYLKGRYFWDRRTPDDLTKAIDYFTQAIVKDPSDAQAYVGLADCYNLLREFGAMPPAEAYPRALSAAQRAVDLDARSAEGHISLAFVTYWWLWHGVTAEREFKQALELNPNLVRAHHWYGTFLLGEHRFPEALDQMEQARRLEPSSNAILADKGDLLWESGHAKEAIALLQELETTDPALSSAHDYLGRIYLQQGNYPKWLAETRRVAELRHDDVGLSLANAREKGFAAGGLKGMYERELPVEKDLVDRGSGNAYVLAQVYAALGRKPDALATLQISFDRHEAPMLLGDPIPELLNDPTYQKFRAQVSQMRDQ